MVIINYKTTVVSPTSFAASATGMDAVLLTRSFSTSSTPSSTEIPHYR